MLLVPNFLPLDCFWFSSSSDYPHWGYNGHLFNFALLYVLLDFGIFHGSWSTQGNSGKLRLLFFLFLVLLFFPFIFGGFTMDQKGYNVSLDLYLLPGNHHVSFTFQHSVHVPLYKIWLISVLLLNWCMVLNKMLSLLCHEK